MDEDRELGRLKALMARLRGPSGCPWDRQQNEQTLKKYLIEEAYEALEAIEVGTPDELKEELGDLLLQIVFLSRLAEEKGHFDLAQVVHSLAEKIIRRHPHVFPASSGGEPSAQAGNAGEVVKIWETVKEREAKKAGDYSILDGLPVSLPALACAQRMSERVSRVGFDWPNAEGIWEKIHEEMAELEEAERHSSPEAVEEELGDLFFALVNWARFKGISAEEALRKANRRFAHRFRQVESGLRRRGRTPAQSTLEEMDQLWSEAKEKE